LSLKETFILYVILGLTCCAALAGLVYVPKLGQIFNVLGEYAELPICTVWVLDTAWFWIVLPVTLFLLHLWTVFVKQARRLQHRVWFVVVFGGSLAILLMGSSVICLWLPLRFVTPGLAP